MMELYVSSRPLLRKGTSTTVPVGSAMALVKRAWVPLVMVLVIAIASFAVVRLHGVFGRQSVSAGGANGVDTLVQFNPKHVLYDVWGPPAPSSRSTTSTSTPNRRGLQRLRCHGATRSSPPTPR